jgi:hypothetical protein
MSEVAFRRRIAALVVMAFVSVMGATVAASTAADSAEARYANCNGWQENQFCYPGWGGY